jgi:hypothetical protein
MFTLFLLAFAARVVGGIAAKLNQLFQELMAQMLAPRAA